ncbi:MAG: enoyl-CoA hydratase/isomerase family protein [Pseudomonadales bacterium]|jgi:3-hydroxyacyl-CoA dehydrogenase|nr:enoyl-CoA hydratase/isomerase family protein [Gammaproteobacteria bacterium]MBP6050736.1 enoyl-CoA hydratase/isomerase family protein [Pseudomonadales bacterium]MBK6584474.1 enoyl-CoA hydratase/isomerase family protein [Gammaproteobacteria bacterium]MBK7520932.1 enoyl-CoA hydratase/isomerase family protein [Gammaproteobacteria bacterium]MBK9667543.1 enoyl-CoA hydratase/isomerase family protein [Gammaproteobacteria bacterium]
MTEVLGYTREGNIALITIDNPPVNALSHAVRAALARAIERAAGDDSRALVLMCAGRTFIAGADITEFGKPAQPPSLPEVLDQLEALGKPVVVAIHGNALGGGLETAMAAHYRIALREARVGLPEVKLGLLPGAGGTQRAPRLMGVKAALDFMIKGQPVAASVALEMGLLDRIVDGDLRAAALDYARELVAAAAKPRPTRAIVPDLAGIDAAWFAAQREVAAKSSRGATAPQRIVDAIELGVSCAAAEAATRTREIFVQLMNSTESRALRHLFFAERAAARLPADCRAVARRPVIAVAVIGGGTMGAGIAINFADYGLPVTMLEMDAAAAGRGLARMRDSWEASRARGRLTEAQLNERLARVRVTTDFADIAAADLVVEAVFEDLGVKQDVFRKLDAVCRAGAILASNTSYQDLDAIAAVTSRPGDVIGMHYFSPANVMKLLEVVRGRETAPDVVATVMELARGLGKVPALVGVCYGFVGNRMLTPYGREVQMLLLEGATPAQVDSAMESFGMAMGPCAVSDLAGLDIGYKARKARSDLPDDPRYFRIGNLLVERGRLGQKSGKGFYAYPDGRKRVVDPDVEALIRMEAAALGVEPRTIGDVEIVERLVYALVNEGARVLEEGIAQRASDIDLIYTNGYGFPVARGGPMFYAETLGLKAVHERICEFREQHGAQYWEPAPLLRSLAIAGKGFGGG